ncbi:bacteriorhodopsin [Bacillus weihaiensis]|nr:bacteriorhodopsin [Bacillus weihaiensis]
MVSPWSCRFVYYSLYHMVSTTKIAVRGGKQLSSHYTRTAAYLTVFWISYPTVWLLGPSGLGLAQATTELIAFIFLPIFSKVGFSILDLNGLRHLEKGRAL